LRIKVAKEYEGLKGAKRTKAKNHTILSAKISVFKKIILRTTEVTQKISFVVGLLVDGYLPCPI
jgi:hypothetical protein